MLDKERLESEVRHAFESLVAASEALDVPRYLGHFDAEKFVGLNADGTVWESFEALRALIEPAFLSIEKIDSLQFDKVKISVIDADTVLLVNEYQQQATLKSGDVFTSAGGGTQVWSKESGSWKLVSVSSSARTI